LLNKYTGYTSTFTDGQGGGKAQRIKSLNKNKMLKLKTLLLVTIYLLTSPVLNAQLYWENKKELREKITFLTAKNESLKNEIEQKNTTNKIEITKLNNLYLENKNEIAKSKAENLYAISKLNLTLQKLKDSISNIHFSNDFEFGFIADNKYIVITDSINTNWIKGPPILSEEAEGAYATAITEVNLELLPAKYLDFLNKKIKIYSENENAYIAKIKSLKLLVKVAEGFDGILSWGDNNFEDGRKYTTEQIALILLEKSYPHYLVAEFEVENIRKITENYVFGLPSNKSTEVFLSVTSTKSTEVKNKINYMLRSQTKNYEDVQLYCNEETKNRNTKWWNCKLVNEEFNFFELKNGICYAVINHRVGDMQVVAGVGSIWKIIEGKQPILLYIGEELHDIQKVIDIDADNTPEFICNDFMSCSLLKIVEMSCSKKYIWDIYYYGCWALNNEIEIEIKHTAQINAK